LARLGGEDNSTDLLPLPAAAAAPAAAALWLYFGSIIAFGARGLVLELSWNPLSLPLNRRQSPAANG
jgi:hypothetical protein